MDDDGQLKEMFEKLSKKYSEDRANATTAEIGDLLRVFDAQTEEAAALFLDVIRKHDLEANIAGAAMAHLLPAVAVALGKDGTFFEAVLKNMRISFNQLREMQDD